MINLESLLLVKVNKFNQILDEILRNIQVKNHRVISLANQKEKTSGI